MKTGRRAADCYVRRASTATQEALRAYRMAASARGRVTSAAPDREPEAGILAGGRRCARGAARVRGRGQRSSGYAPANDHTPSGGRIALDAKALRPGRRGFPLGKPAWRSGILPALQGDVGQAPPWARMQGGGPQTPRRPSTPARSRLLVVGQHGESTHPSCLSGRRTASSKLLSSACGPSIQGFECRSRARHTVSASFKGALRPSRGSPTGRHWDLCSTSCGAPWGGVGGRDPTLHVRKLHS
jgi:hypothetical protein